MVYIVPIRATLNVSSIDPAILQNQTAIATDNLAQQEIEESIEIVYNYLSACLIDAPRPIIENLILSKPPSPRGDGNNTHHHTFLIFVRSARLRYL